MGSQVPVSGGQGGLTPEALAAIQQLTAQGALNQAAQQVAPMPANPDLAAYQQQVMAPGGLADQTAAQVNQNRPTLQGQGLLANILGRFFAGTSAKELAGGAQGGGAVTPEELQRQRQQFAQ